MKTKSILIFLLISIFYFSCKEECPPLQSINFKVEKNGATYTCTWNKTNISSFKNYTIYISEAPIEENVNFNELVISPIHIDDQRISESVFNISELKSDLYFQLRVNISDRLLYSEVIHIENKNIHIFPIFSFDQVLFYPEIQTLYFIEFSDNKLTAYNLITKEFVETILITGGYDIWFDRSAAGNNGMGEELYLVDDLESILILDARTLEVKSTFEPNHPVTEVATNKNGMIAIGIEGNIKLYERDGMNFLTELDEAVVGTTYGLEFSPDTINRLIHVGQTEIHTYDLNNNGEIVTHKTKPNPYQTNYYNAKLSVAPSGNYFTNHSNEIFNADLNALARLISPYNTEYFFPLFGENDSFIYCASYGANPNLYPYEIHKISLSDFSVVDIFAFDTFIPVLLFQLEDTIMMVSKYSSLNRIVLQPAFE